MITNANGDVIDKGKWNGEFFEKLSYARIKDFSPKTIKQEFLCDLLSNVNIPIKIVSGVAGSGKTKLCMTYGIHFLSKRVYDKFFVIRHNVGIGERNGFLPGSKFDKVRGWLGFFEDNLDEVQYTIEEMVTRGTLDVDAVEYMKGRDIKNSWMMIDEAEDLTEEEFKMLGERASAGTSLCFIGDYDQATQDKYKRSSGLKRAIEKLAGNPKVGIVVFDDKENDNVRSDISKIFTYLY
jgi:PhoH-like ATPase